jgi:hypothetical protein
LPQARAPLLSDRNPPDVDYQKRLRRTPGHELQSAEMIDRQRSRLPAPFPWKQQRVGRAALARPASVAPRYPTSACPPCAEGRTAGAPPEPGFRIPEWKQPSDAGDKTPAGRPERNYVVALLVRPG